MAAQDTSRLLLVEDQAIVAMNQRMMLEENGFSVLTVHSGEDAVALIARGEPVDLILMDIDLGPGMDGPEAARRVLSIAELPIVFLTAHAERQYVDRVREITRYGYVLKHAGEFVLLQSIEMAFELFRAQQAVRQSEREWSDLYENAPIAYFTVTEEGVISRCNRQAERLLGSDRSQIVGTGALELCAHTEGTREHAAGLFERAGCGETVEDEELILHAPGGADIPVSVSMNPIRAPEAEAADYRMMVTDISHRKQAEDELRRSEQIYRAIVENVADVVAWYDGELNLRYVSPQAKRLFGYELADFAELSVFDIVHPDDRELVFTRVKGAIAAGAGQITLTYRARQHNGKYRLVENRATHLYDASGKLTDVISIVRPAAGENLGSNRHAAPQASP